MAEPIPVVVFGFKRPDKLARILSALRGQTEAAPRLLIFIDGPRRADDLPGVEACRALARGVDFAPTELHLWEENHGLPGLLDNLTLALEAYPWVVVVEDDCLPMPGFYAFMRQALERYRDHPEVFSIGAYQPLPPAYFKDCPSPVVSTARFMCWGWATWRDRWQALLPDARRYRELFDGLRTLPDFTGLDLPLTARRMASGQMGESWDVNVAVAALHQRKVHLLATHGLVRNIGMDLSGIHTGLGGALRDALLQNRNLADHMPGGLTWPESTGLDCDYAVWLREFVAQTRRYAPRRLWQRGRTLARRYLWPGRERFFDLDLRPPEETAGDPTPPAHRALLSYIVHPFSIPRDDPRFLRHINIWHAQEMVRALNRIGYRVDVIDYRDTRFRPERNYDLFIGHGGVNFTTIAQGLPPETRRIYLATGSYWQFHNQQEQARFEALAQRRGARLPLDRPIRGEEEAALRLAEGILGIGNEFTRRTYAAFERVEMVNGSSLDDATYDWCLKDLDAGRNHFLFFASGGNVHKGLDLVLEAFAGLEQHLWVVAPLDPAFEAIYRRELNDLPTIHRVGRVQPRSAAFYRLMRACNWCILPSCSEGQSQSVIEAMNQGLIPIVSRTAGLDVDGLGFWLEPPTVEAIRRVAQMAASLPLETCRQLSQKARAAVLDQYAEACFSPQFSAALKRLLAGKVG